MNKIPLDESGSALLHDLTAEDLSIVLFRVPMRLHSGDDVGPQTCNLNFLVPLGWCQTNLLRVGSTSLNGQPMLEENSLDKQFLLVIVHPGNVSPNAFCPIRTASQQPSLAKEMFSSKGCQGPNGEG